MLSCASDPEIQTLSTTLAQNGAKAASWPLLDGRGLALHSKRNL